MNKTEIPAVGNTYLCLKILIVSMCMSIISMYKIYTLFVILGLNNVIIVGILAGILRQTNVK